MTTSQLRLFSDDPAETDLLAFRAVAATVADALIDADLDPVALGLSGSWGSGKTTVLNLIEQELDLRATEDAQVLIVRTDPWRYDPAQGVKESLISEILGVLTSAVDAGKSSGGRAKELLARISSRIDWAKALKLATTSAITLQIPDIDKIFELVRKPEDGGGGSRGMEEFRNEFQELLASDELSPVRAVVVLVDDLDRCLPETVVETLETTTPSAADARVLGVGRTAPLLLLTQQISTATGTPFEHSRILFRGDKIRLEFHYDL